MLATPYVPKVATLPPTSTRKRKRQDDKLLPPLPAPVTIHPHASLPTNPFDPPPPVFTPATLLHKHLFPLQWLGGCAPRLFTASNLHALDSGLVMIVKVEGERTLFAVECIQPGLYALAKLGSWVRLGDVRRLGTEAKRLGQTGFEKRACVDNVDSCEWWRDAAIDMDSESEDIEGWEVDVDMPDVGVSEAQTTITPPPEEELFQEPGKDDILSQVKAQYYETVYLAKTNIAYFAKSTLARARVFFTDGKGEVKDLIEFLEGMVLSLDAMDVKYKRAIISIAMDEQGVDEKHDFKEEVEYIHRWVAASFGEHAVLKREDKALANKVEELKIRETELQIILLLEIMALRQDANLPEPGTMEEPNRKKNKLGKKSKKKSKAPKELNKDLMLDLLVDRLCIWRSLGSSLAGTLGDSKHSIAANFEQDSLRHFCVEVVMAFYSSRLPAKCASISKKCNLSQPAATPSAPKPTRPLQKKRSFARSATAPTTSMSPDALASSLSKDALMPKSKARTGALDASKLSKREISVSTINVKSKDTSLMGELKDAIQALKKPNRALQGEMDMKTRESRLFGGFSKSSIRKSNNPTRIPPSSKAASSILVAATPSKPKAGRDDVPTLDRKTSSEFLETPFAKHLLAIPESSPFTLVSPLAGVTDTPPRTSRPAARGFDLGTPTRPKRLFSRSHTVGGVLQTPERGVLETPVRGLGGLENMANVGGGGVLETPVRKVNFGGARKGTGVSLNLGGGLKGFVEAYGSGKEDVEEKENVDVGETSIVERLGWDEEDFEL